MIPNQIIQLQEAMKHMEERSKEATAQCQSALDEIAKLKQELCSIWGRPMPDSNG